MNEPDINRMRRELIAEGVADPLRVGWRFASDFAIAEAHEELCEVESAMLAVEHYPALAMAAADLLPDEHKTVVSALMSLAFINGWAHGRKCGEL